MLPFGVDRGISRGIGGAGLPRTRRAAWGWHSGGAGVCLWAVHGAKGLRVLTVVGHPETP